MIAKLIAWGDDRAARRSRGWRARSREYQVARHPDDDPVLPVADARSRTTATGGSTRRTSIGCSPSAARRELQRARRRATKSSSRWPRRSTRACARSARRRRPAAGAGSGSAWQRAARARGAAADDVRDRGQRPDPHASSIERGGGPGGSASRRRRRARRRRGPRRRVRRCRCSSTATPAVSREVQVAPGGAPGELLDRARRPRP